MGAYKKYSKKNFVHHRSFYNFVVLKDDSSLSRKGTVIAHLSKWAYFMPIKTVLYTVAYT